MIKDKSKTIDKIDKGKLPSHIAIIMDGNGRWAKKKFLPRTAGHISGVERVRDIIEASTELEIPFITLYAFSTENWKRPKQEIDVLMELLIKYLKKETKNLHKNGVKLRIIGDMEPLSEKVILEVNRSIEETKNNSKLTLNIALNYGSRQEIVKAFKEIHRDINKGKLSIDDINEDLLSNYLYTKDQPDPDLVIRTSGEQRVSNFLLYQIAYSEFDFVDELWPDFNKESFYQSIIKFQQRTRRYGGI